MVTTQNTIATLNSLLRGELAATQTYQQALVKIEDHLAPGAEGLRQIHRQHREAANQLRLLVRRFGGTPDQDSGVWGTFAQVVEGAAVLLGDRAALAALREGEEHGIGTYREALCEDLPPEGKDLISATLLPQTLEHVALLERLSDAV